MQEMNKKVSGRQGKEEKKVSLATQQEAEIWKENMANDNSHRDGSS